VEDLQTLVSRRLDYLYEHEKSPTGTGPFTAADAVRRAAQNRRKITEARLSQIAAMPSGEKWGERGATNETIHAIAFGLDLPLERVVDAAMRSRGFPIPARKSDQATVSGICPTCPSPSGEFDELVIRVPRPDLPTEVVALLKQEVQKTVTRTLERCDRTER
jgi:hypothetical protein